MRTSIWARFGATGVVYCAIVGVFLGNTSLGFKADVLWGVLVTALLLLVFAVCYRVLVGRVEGRHADTWALPDATAVVVRLPAEPALARVQTIAETVYPTVRVAKDGGALLLTKPGGMWLGNSTVRVQAKDKDGTTELLFSADSAKLMNNGLCRGMIGRLMSELASAKVWSEDGTQPLTLT